MTVPGTCSGQPLSEGWCWVRLKETGVFEAGGTPAKERTDYWNGEIPFVTGADITELCITKTNARAYLTSDGLHSGKTIICEAGTILIVTRTRVGRVGIAQEIMGASQDITAFKCGPEIHQEFLCRYLHNISEHLIDNCRGATIQGLTREFVSNLEIPLPPLAKQQRIADVLKEQMGEVEKARVAVQERLEAVKALPAAFLRQVFPQPGQPLPNGWRWVKLGEIARTTSGSTPTRSQSIYYKEGDIPWVKTGELYDGYIEQSDESITRQALDECSLPLLPPGTLLIAMYGQGQTRGRTGILRIHATTNQACFAILPNEKEFFSPYLQAWFRHNYNRIRSETERRGGNQPNLNGQILKEMSILLPPLAEQKRYVALLLLQLEAVEKARTAAEAELNTINDLPAALLRRAFSGEL